MSSGIDPKEGFAVVYDSFLDNLGSKKSENSNISKRYNSGKIQTKEIDPNFILAMGEVLTKSRLKYDAFNWTLPTKVSTPIESFERHFLAFKSGEDLDSETQCQHLAHCAVNLMFAMYHLRENKEYADDRFFKKKDK